MSDILWIADTDAEFLIGADGYPYDCPDEDGKPIALYHISDDTELRHTPGAIVRLLVVADGEGDLWGTEWSSLRSGYPGHLWSGAKTKLRQSDNDRGEIPVWVGFQPVETEIVQTTVYRLKDAS